MTMSKMNRNQQQRLPMWFKRKKQKKTTFSIINDIFRLVYLDFYLIFLFKHTWIFSFRFLWEMLIKLRVGTLRINNQQPREKTTKLREERKKTFQYINTNKNRFFDGTHHSILTRKVFNEQINNVVTQTTKVVRTKPTKFRERFVAHSIDFVSKTEQKQNKQFFIIHSNRLNGSRKSQFSNQIFFLNLAMKRRVFRFRWKSKFDH